MIKNKKGFTLAEVLISVGIISVIATFAFTISQRGIERAYDQYVYTGYKGLIDAILSGLTEGVVFDGELGDIDYIRNVLNAKQEGNNPSFFTAPNKIKYQVFFRQGHYYFKMILPSLQRNDVRRESCLAYFPEKNYGILLPYRQNSVCTSTLDLSMRKDLLPFYIDDGIVGRTQYNQATESYEYKPIENFYSAQEAVCRVFTGNIESYDHMILYSCDDLQDDQGVVRAINPRKIRAN